MKNRILIKNIPSDEKVAEWNAKETTEGAQQKADEALRLAKEYADQNKVAKEEGKGLSTEDFTTEEKEKLAGLFNYVHPEKHTTDDITTNTENRFVSDAQINDWTNKETVGGAQSKATKALEDAKDYTDEIYRGLNSKKIDYVEMTEAKHLIFKADAENKFDIDFSNFNTGGSGGADYILPIASDITLGGVKIGKGINISEDGTISLDESVPIGSITWEKITDKPLTFTPSLHQHSILDLTDMFKVEDSLVSESKSNALSAFQGKELKSMIDSIHTHENLDTLNKLTEEKFNELETISGATEKDEKTLQDAKNYVDQKFKDYTTVTTYKKIISTEDWIDDIESSLCKFSINHSLNTLDIIVKANSANEINHSLNELISYQIIDENNIDIFAEDKDSLNISIIGIQRIKEPTDSIAPIKIERTVANNLELDEISGLYKQIINHNLKSENIIIEAINNSTLLSELISYKPINTTSVEIYAEDNEFLNLLIMSIE